MAIMRRTCNPDVLNLLYTGGNLGTLVLTV